MGAPPDDKLNANKSVGLDCPLHPPHLRIRQGGRPPQVHHRGPRCLTQLLQVGRRSHEARERDI